jgi:hypothetical protein
LPRSAPWPSCSCRGSSAVRVGCDAVPGDPSDRPLPTGRGVRQWQVPVPLSVKVFPAIGMNCQL